MCSQAGKFSEISFASTRRSWTRLGSRGTNAPLPLGAATSTIIAPQVGEAARTLDPSLDPMGAKRAATGHHRTDRGPAEIGQNPHRTARTTTRPHDGARLAASLRPPLWLRPSPR